MTGPQAPLEATAKTNPPVERPAETSNQPQQQMMREGYSQARVETPAANQSAEQHLPQVSVVEAPKPEEKPRQLNDETIRQYANDLHTAINATGWFGRYTPDNQKVFQLLQSLGEADRKAIMEAYKNAPGNTNHRDIKTEMKERMGEADFRKAESMLNTRDGRTNDAGNLMMALTHINENRGDGERRVIETFATLNSTQMAQLREDFQKDYGMSIDKALQQYGLSPEAKRVVDFVSKPVEQRTAKDIEDLARFAVEKRSLDYLSIALRGDSPQAQEARRVLQNDPEFNKKLVDAFKPVQGGFGLGPVVDYMLGPIDEIVTGLYRGDLTLGKVVGGVPIIDAFGSLVQSVGARKENLELLTAMDLVREGRQSLSTIALNNTGSLFGWFDNKENISLAVNNASQTERDAFRRGRELVGTNPQNEQDKNARAYYERLHATFESAGDPRERAMWEAKLLNGKDSLQAKLAEPNNRDGRFSAIENMSREDWTRLHDPQRGPQFRAELDQFLTRFVGADERTKLLELIDKKAKAGSFEASQNERRTVSQVINDNFQSGFFSNTVNGRNIISGIEKMNADEARNYKANPSQTDEFIRRNLTPDERRYAEHMLRQIAQTGKPYEKNPAGEVLANAASGADTKTQLKGIETLLQNDPELRRRLSGDITKMNPEDKALRETINKVLGQAVLSAPRPHGADRGARSQFGPGFQELSRHLFETGRLPVDLKARFGLKNRSFYEEAAQATPEERQRLFAGRNINDKEKQLIEKVAEQGGQMRLEDKLRSFVLGDGSNSQEFKDELTKLSPEAKQKLKEDYVKKYGTALEQDFLQKFDKAEDQRTFRNLLTPSQLDGRQDYYDNLDQWLRSRNSGWAPDGTPITVERAMTDQAALHQWFNSRFEKMPPEIRDAANEYFKTALQQNRDSKAKMAEFLATVAITAAALAATPFTGGASLALVSAIAFAAGGVAKVAIHRAVEGGDYDWNKALGQFVGGGTEGALNMLGGKLVEGMFKGFNMTGNALYGSMLSRGLVGEGGEAVTGRAFTKLISQGKNVSEAALDDFVRAVAPGADQAAQQSIRQAAREAVVQNFDHIVNRATFTALAGVDNGIVGGGSGATMTIVQSMIDGRPITASEVIGSALVGAMTGAVVGTLIRGGIEGRDIYVQSRRAPNGEQVIVPSKAGEKPIVLEDSHGNRRTVTEETKPGGDERIVDGPQQPPRETTPPRPSVPDNNANPTEPGSNRTPGEQTPDRPAPDQSGRQQQQRPNAGEQNRRPDQQNRPDGQDQNPGRDATIPGADTPTPAPKPDIPPRTAKFEETLTKLEKDGGERAELARRIREMTPEETYRGGVDEMLNAGKAKTRDLADRVRYAELLKRVDGLKPLMPEGLHDRIIAFMGEPRKATQSSLKLQDLDTLLKLSKDLPDQEVARRLDGYFRAISDSGVRTPGKALSDVFSEEEIAVINRMRQAQDSVPKVELKPEERDALAKTSYELARREVPGGNGPGQDKVMHIVVGLPASGKSGHLVPELARSNRAMVIDSDAVAPQIPGYTTTVDGVVQVGIGAQAVQQEAGRIATTVLNEAIAHGDNIVYPFVGRDAQALMRKIIQAKEAGYRVEVHFADVPPEVAARRAYERSEGPVVDGRRQIVNPQFVLDLGNGPADAFNRVITEMPWLIDGWTRWNTNVPRGTAPQIAARSPQG